MMSRDFDLDTIPHKDDSIMVRKVKDEAYLVKSNSEKVEEEKLWVLNPTASFVWENIDGKRTCSDILNDLIEQFDAEPDRIKEDFINLLIQLRDQGLLSLSSNWPLDE